jgi:uncharacterized LabA/DUF88 family protein
MNPPKTKKRVIVYVDGFNFYYGLRSVSWQRYYWLDMVDLFERFMRDDKELVAVRYFTARPLNEHKKQRQAAFLDANLCNPKFHVYYGNYAKRLDPDTNQMTGIEEKKTDVQIAVWMLKDALLEKQCDVIMLVSGDTDQVPAIRMIQKLNGGCEYIAVFPPNRENGELRNMANGHIDLIMHEGKFKKSPLPDSLVNSKEREIYCPPRWNKAKTAKALKH